MIVVLYILFFLAALILILLVMVQDEQGEGIGGMFGGGSSTPFGSRSGNVLTRLTGILVAVFLIICLVMGLFNRSAERKAIAEQEIEEGSTREKFFEPLKRKVNATPQPELPDTSSNLQ